MKERIDMETEEIATKETLDETAYDTAKEYIEKIQRDEEVALFDTKDTRQLDIDNLSETLAIKLKNMMNMKKQ